MRNGITHENIGKPVFEYTDSDIKRINEVYICFDFSCNLCCPHCTLHKIKQEHHFDKILDTLNYLHDKNKKFTINFFGGEPTLLKDDVWKLYEDVVKVHPLIISTNLLKLSPYKIQYMKYSEDINTSWNPKRFTNDQYKLWLNNIEILKQNNIPYSVMVTLTDDLIDMDQKEFIELVKLWSPRNIDLKMMIGDYNMDFSKVDEWLCKLYDIWNIDKTKNLLFNEIKQICEGKRIWKNYCKTYFTIMPNGYLKDGCPYFEYETDKTNCLMCEYYSICQGGCNIQEKCTFPKKLYQRIAQ